MVEYSDPAARAAATVGVGAASTSYTYLGLPLADLIGFVTIGYLLVQTGVTLRPHVVDLYRWLKRRKQ